MAGSLKLELSQYSELLAFAQFGSELDKASQQSLDRGTRAIELLKQGKQQTFSFVDQVLFLFLLNENFLDKQEIDIIKKFAEQFAQYVQANYQECYKTIKQTENIVEETLVKLRKAATEFTNIFSK